MMITESERKQYEVEKELAARLRSSTREERTDLFKSLYNELFQRVPQHVRLERRDTPEQSTQAVAARMRLLQPHLRTDSVMLEFAPGDCRLAIAATTLCKKVIGVDISDQHNASERLPENLQLIIYDGYNLEVAESSVDVVFSYQFLEHLHPDDVDLHFALVAKVLKPGGYYIFDTPHRYSGPHDISGSFGHSLDCLHMQEWTSRELRNIAIRHGMSGSWIFRFGKVRRSKIINMLNDAVESICGFLPASTRRRICRRAFGSVTMMVQKG